MKLKAWLSRNKDFFNPRDWRFLLKQIYPKKALPLRRLEKIKADYKRGVPIAYSLGKEEFYGLEFKINKNVLVPRPETEILVEKALEIIEKNRALSGSFPSIHPARGGTLRERVVSKGATMNVLDLCCGSGVIAVAIKKFAAPKVMVTAADFSKKALSLARANARAHKAAIRFVQGDLFVPLKNKKFDLILANPPYVAGKDIRGSLLHEPRLALYAADNGLAIIKKIIIQASHFLNLKGALMIEVGFNQRARLDKFLSGVSFYANPVWIKDYSGHNRLLCLTKNYPLQ